MTVSFSIKTSASRREIPSCRARNLLSRSGDLPVSCGVFIVVAVFLEGYSVVLCDAGTSVRRVSSNCMPDSVLSAGAGADAAGEEMLADIAGCADGTAGCCDSVDGDEAAGVGGVPVGEIG